MSRLQPGDVAPPFELPDQDGRQVSLAQFRGRKLLLYFYPKADTPGCTTQACTIRDAKSELEALGVAALGISPDPPGAQKKFDAKYGLGFPLLSDVNHQVAEAYGVWGEKKMYGKTTQGIIRSAFLIDEEGRIMKAWYQVKPADTVALATKALASG